MTECSLVRIIELSCFQIINSRLGQSAAVAGNVFASPTASQVTRAIELVDSNEGFVCMALFSSHNCHIPFP